MNRFPWRGRWRSSSPPARAFSTISLPADCRGFEAGLHEFLEARHPGTLSRIREEKALDDSLRTEIRTAVAEFKREVFRPSAEPAGGAAA